jgi:hypothetical protein
MRWGAAVKTCQREGANVGRGVEVFIIDSSSDLEVYETNPFLAGAAGGST